MISKIKKFFIEVILELKKVSWPTRAELLSSTWIVVVSSAFLGIFIGISDLIISRFIALIL